VRKRLTLLATDLPIRVDATPEWIDWVTLGGAIAAAVAAVAATVLLIFFGIGAPKMHDLLAAELSPRGSGIEEIATGFG
jgi:hypothetical protein